MPTGSHKSPNRGAVVKPLPMRVFRRAVFTTAEGEARWNPEATLPSLQPLQLRWGSNGEMTTLAMKYQLGQGPGRASRERPEDAGIYVGTGDEIVLYEILPGHSPNRPHKAEWFRGHVGQERIFVQADREEYSVTAYGPEMRLKGKAIHGQWHRTIALDDKLIAETAALTDLVFSNVIITDLPVVFNPAGKPNASGQADAEGVPYDYSLAPDLTEFPSSVSIYKCKVFEAPERVIRAAPSERTQINAVHWTAYTALRSLVEWFDEYDVISPHTDWNAIEAVLAGAVIDNVAVEGMSLLDAMRAVLLPVGFGFYLDMWADPDDAKANAGWLRHVLHVFPLGGWDESSDVKIVRYPPMPDVRQSIGISSAAGQRALVQRLDFLRDAHHVANDILVIGDVRRRQVSLEFDSDADTRDLHPFWDASTHDLADYADDNENVEPKGEWSATDFDTFCKQYNYRGKNHPQYHHVFRSFVWNEDGGACPTVPTSKIPNLSDYGIGDSANWARRPRPFGPCLVYDESNARIRPLGVIIQMGIEGDADSWITVTEAQPMKDRAGFTITARTLMGEQEAQTWRPYKDVNAKSGDDTLSDLYGEHTYLTLLHNTLRDAGTKLRFRMIGSIACDDAVEGRAERQLDTSWPFTSQRVLYRPDRFKWRDVVTDPFSLSQNTRNDTADALIMAGSIRDASQNSLGHGSLTLRILTRGYPPGTNIPATSDRDIPLYTDGGGRKRSPIVVGVSFDFREGVNKTELVLDSPLLRTAR